MLDGDILVINRPLAAYISLGKVVLRMRRKNSSARSETNSKRAGSRHCGSKLSQPTVQPVGAYHSTRMDEDIIFKRFIEKVSSIKVA